MRHKLGILLIIFFLAVAVRLIYVEQIKDSILFSHPVSDSGDYHRAGIKLAAGTLSEQERARFFRIPLYHNFLSIIYLTGGPHPYFAAFAQVFLGAASCCLVYLLGRLVFSDKIGVLAGILSCLYWPLAAFGAKTLPVNLSIFFSLLSALFMTKFLKDGKWRWILLGGFTLALASLTRPNFLVLFPVLLLWLLFSSARRAALARKIWWSMVFVVGVLSIILPAILAEYAARKEFIPVQKNYAATAYMGSKLELIELRPGSAWRKKMIELLRKDLISREERDTYWFGEIREMFIKDPPEFIYELLRKIYILLNRYEFAPYESINVFRGKSAFLSFPFLNFGSIISFAILGMLLVRGSPRQEAALVYIYVLTYFISLLPFPPLARYRLPLAPFFIIFAAYCVMDLFEAVRAGRWKYLSKFSVLFLPLFLLTNTNPLLSYLDSFRRPSYHEGRAYLEEDADKALGLLQKALFRRSNDADIYEAMGDAYLLKEDLRRAEICYKLALELEPDFPEAMEKIGIIYGKRGEIEEAIDVFKKVQSSFPLDYASIHINLAACYLLQGNEMEARKELQRALEIEPGNMQALYKLTELAEKTGAPDAPMLRKRLNKALEKYRLPQE
ncbi:MAG: glycosyltransferase family 39 protein [Candidatus Omnitrophota bacterium]